MLKVSGSRGAVSLLAYLFVACGNPTANVDTGSENGASDGEIVSNRPQTDPFFTAIVRLTQPPLLVSAKKVDGKLQVDAAAKKKLLDEQERFISQVKALPGDVKILHTYRLTLNAVAVLAPIELEEHFAKMAGVIDYSKADTFLPPTPEATGEVTPGAPSLTEKNSVTFIGAGRARAELGLTGQGIRVGVVDTGVDYTHKMFGGAGTPEAYSKNDPAVVEQGSFPTAKVVGGIDLVGSEYNTSLLEVNARVPKPDADPLDEGGHGSHVAGTIAGHGDGTQTYDGVAPDAQLYAIKIFGKDGSTGTGPILASFEYAADPDQNLDPADRLDVINLSLGAGWGTRFATYYGEAVKNLAAAGTLTVISAGNSGPVPFIVGSPSTADDAVSVAATIDDSPWNWKFDAARFSYAGNTNHLVRIYDAAFAKPSKDASSVSGKLVYLGTAAKDLDDATKAKVRGKVALIDRGEVSFFDKVRRAVDAGAIGVVVANNTPADPFTMGGGDEGVTFDIPAIMVPQTLGTLLKAELKIRGTASVTFWSGQQIQKPELVDALTSFSSRGPRSIDALIKPELSAPGELIISAAMGSGFEGVKFSGTSMSAPHVTGAAALLRQAIPTSTAGELKARLMSTGARAHSLTGAVEVAGQGAGRIRIVEAARATVVVTPPALSLGVLSGSGTLSRPQTLSLRNLSSQTLTARLTSAPKPGLTVTAPGMVTLPAQRTTQVTVNITIDPSTSTDPVTELDNFLQLDISGGAAPQSLVVPLLAVVKRGSSVQAASVTQSTQGLTHLSLTNQGPQAGEALPFNLLGTVKPTAASAKQGPCALTAVGYRVVSSTDGTTQLLQFGVHLAESLSTWNACEVSVLIDTTNDDTAEQELAGAGEAGLWPGPVPSDRFASFLVDAKAMRDIQVQAESPDAGEFPPDSAAVLDIQPFQRFPFSKVGVISADLGKVARTRNGLLRVKVGTLPFYEGGVRDNFLGGDGEGEWFVLDPNDLPFRGMPASVPVTHGQTVELSTQRFVPGTSLLLLLPQNDSSLGSSLVIPASGAPTYLK